MKYKQIALLFTLFSSLFFVTQTVVAQGNYDAAKNLVTSCAKSHFNLQIFRACVKNKLDGLSSVSPKSGAAGAAAGITGNELARYQLKSHHGAYPVACCKTGACPFNNHMGSCGYCMLYCAIRKSHECKEKVSKTQCIKD